MWLYDILALFLHGIHRRTFLICRAAPEDALVFEDSKVGAQAAWNARIPVIMVPDLMPPTEVQKRQAIKIIASLSEAVPIIEELSKDGTKHERCT